MERLNPVAIAITFSTLWQASLWSIASSTALCSTCDRQGIPLSLLVLATAALILLPRSLVTKHGISELMCIPVESACSSSCFSTVYATYAPTVVRKSSSFSRSCIPSLRMTAYLYSKIYK